MHAIALCRRDNEEHTVVKVGEECHSYSVQRRLVFVPPDDCGVCQLTIMAAANNERVRVRVSKISFASLFFFIYFIYYRVSAYFVLSYMATPQQF